MKLLIKKRLLAASLFLPLAIMAATVPLSNATTTSLATVVVILLGALGIIFGLKALTIGWLNLSNKMQQRLLISIVVVILISQLLVAFNFIDYGRADSFFVRNQAIALADNTHVWNHYFQVYSNNVNLALLEGLLVKIARLVNFSNPWMVISIFQFLWIDTALWAGFKILTAWHLASLKISYAIIWFVTVPIYTYGVFIYSDALVLPIPVVVLALYLWWDQQTGDHKWLPAILLTLELLFGTLIKPNMIVMVIAFLIVLAIEGMQHRLSWKVMIGWTISLVIGLGLASAMLTGVAKKEGYQAATNQILPATSWVAMGLDDKTSGKYNYADVHAQMRLATHQQKVRVEKVIIKRRIFQLGLGGLLKQFGRKEIIFFGSGTFGGFNLTNQWRTEPHWYFQNKRMINYRLTVWSQMLYVALLIDCACMFFSKGCTQKNALLILFGLGLAAFHIIFWEVETRYALPLLPVFILWASSRPYQTDSVFISPLVTKKTELRYALITLSCLVLAGMSYREIKLHSGAVIVAEQGDGSYFKNLKQQLRPSESIKLKIMVQAENSMVKLQPFASANNLVKIVIKKDGQVLKTAIGSAHQLRTISYRRQSAGTLQIIIKNVGKQQVSYGTAVSNYPIDRYHISGSKDRYLRYYVLLNQSG